MDSRVTEMGEESPPHEGAWIEMLWLARLLRVPSVAPSWGRGLKSERSCALCDSLAGRPLMGRGLK